MTTNRPHVPTMPFPFLRHRTMAQVLAAEQHKADRNALTRLTAVERDNYDVLRKKGGYSRAEALRKVGREDLAR